MEGIIINCHRSSRFDGFVDLELSAYQQPNEGCQLQRLQKWWQQQMSRQQGGMLSTLPEFGRQVVCMPEHCRTSPSAVSHWQTGIESP